MKAVLVIIAILSLALAFAAHAVAAHYSLRTPGTIIAGQFVWSSQSWGPSNGIFVEIGVDIACWFGILSGLCWLIQKFRS